MKIYAETSQYLLCMYAENHLYAYRKGMWSRYATYNIDNGYKRSEIDRVPTLYLTLRNITNTLIGA